MKNIIKKLLRESINSKEIWYHGSNNKFYEFTNKDNKTYQEIDIPSWFFTKDLEYAKSYGKYLYIVSLDIKNTFNTENKEHFNIFINQLKDWNYKVEEINDIIDTEFNNGLPYWTCNDAIYTAASNGFDSIFIQEELDKEVLSISVFDSSLIKILSIKNN